MITVMGATGRIGRGITDRLLNAGQGRVRYVESEVRMEGSESGCHGGGGQVGWASPAPAVESPILQMPTEKTRGRLRALSDWLRGSTPSPQPAPNAATTAVREGVPSRIGHYSITGKLGQGGMGVV
jgi:hypothetical protein